jgi:superfamily II DNA or RNA helicase
MNRLLRSRRHRAALWCGQDGACARCGELLPDVWHADHVIPWRLRPVTNVHDMQALCPRCNLEKGGKLMQERPQGPRPWQRELIAELVQMRNTRMMLDISPGGGKGSTGYFIGAYAPRDRVNAVCHVAPRTNLRDQAGDRPRWLADYAQREQLWLPEIRPTENVPPLRRGSYGYATTPQSILANPALHYQEFERAKYALILDEPQMMPADGQWSRAMQGLIDRAALVVLMSGTFSRSDGKAILLAPYAHSSLGDTVDFQHPDWTTLRYRRVDALGDEAILPIEFKTFEAGAEFFRSEAVSFKTWGDLIGEQEQRAGLYAVLTHEAGRAIADRMLDDWQNHRQTHRSAQALIITHSQPEARDYLKRIRERYPGVDARVAISDEKASADTIRRFCRGDGEVLITVGMAYVGMDACAISHIALLTYVRQRTWIEQAIARGVRVDPIAGPYRSQRCRVYAPGDPLLKEIIEAIEREQEEALKDADGMACRIEGDERKAVVNSDTIVFSSDLGDAQSHEMNIVSLSSEMTGMCERAIEQAGLSITPVELLKVHNAMMGIEPFTYQTVAPQINVRDREDQLRKAIEQRCRLLDSQRGVAFGATNADTLRRFRKPRPEMNSAELMQVWTWLQTAFEGKAA